MRPTFFRNRFLVWFPLAALLGCGSAESAMSVDGAADNSTAPSEAGGRDGSNESGGEGGSVEAASAKDRGVSTQADSGGFADGATETGPAAVDSGGDGGFDASQADTGADSPSGACLAPDGSFAPLPRGCANGDSDCTYFAHQLNCCGSVQYVGIAKSAAAQAAACESIWEARFPACGCASGIPTIDDGSADVDGAAPQVHCVGSAITGICRTSLL